MASLDVVERRVDYKTGLKSLTEDECEELLVSDRDYSSPIGVAALERACQHLPRRREVEAQEKENRGKGTFDPADQKQSAHVR